MKRSRSPLRVGVFSARPHDREFLLAAADDSIEFSFFESALSPQQAQGFEALCLFVNDSLERPEDVSFLAHHGLRLVLLRCAGFDRINITACQQHQVRVKRVPAYSPHGVAEFGATLMLGALRKLHHCVERVKKQNFLLDGLLGSTVHGKKVAVLGTGQIGACFCRILSGFGPKEIIGWDAYPNLALPKEIPLLHYAPTWEEAISDADIISLHVPLLPATRHLVNKTFLSQVKRGAVLVNTSRGAIVDTEALIEALRSGQLGAYGADVYEKESNLFFADHSDRTLEDETWKTLVSLPNVLITGHLAFFTREALTQIADVVCKNAKNHLDDAPHDHTDVVELKNKTE